MKRAISLTLVFLMSFLLFAVPAAASEDSMSFSFSLTSDGANEVSVSSGDTITVVFTLSRTDADEDYAMYAMQNEITYDSSFFQFVEGSITAESDIKTSAHTDDGKTKIYMNALSLSKSGTSWAQKRIIGSFQLKVIAESGSSSIYSNNYFMSTQGGTDTYSSGASDLNVAVKTSGNTDSGGTSGSSGSYSSSPTCNDSSSDSAGDVSGASFEDVPESAWYYEAVCFAAEHKLFNGTGDGNFSPDMTMSRGMLVTVLWRMDGESAAESAGFDDVDEDTWYTGAVNWAVEDGIVTGYSDTDFGPDDSVTRQQIAAILYRYAEACGYSVSASADLSTYEDQNNIASWARTGMSWANAYGLITGTTDTTLSPEEGATRAQVAAILMRFSNWIEQA